MSKCQHEKIESSDQYSVIHYIRQALNRAIAEADGDETLSRRLAVQNRLRLITMSDEELQELTLLVSRYTNRPAEKIFRELKDKTSELKQTSAVWLKDLL